MSYLEKYFEMAPAPDNRWLDGLGTVANYITIHQDVRVLAMEFLPTLD
jgi:hypothetical protein